MTSVDPAALRRSQIHEEWVGWQTATVDASAIGVLLVGAEFHDIQAAAAISGALYVLGPPTVHLVRGDVAKGLESLGLRLLLPAVGFTVGAAIGRSPIAWPSGGVTVDEMVGIIAGAVGAAGVDAEVLGWKRWEGPPAAARSAAFAFAF
jgi:hypothetical protein